ncbi:unnamed protein product [Brachionus calyciflorus]|uniref:Uncharacterized protein n=1 Tax=Brachionus calyciflorus TaxID=104777 RepID=A0A814SM65_9BILA|nr:unnamed protein product [Brachionus calyciflorus]
MASPENIQSSNDSNMFIDESDEQSVFCFDMTDNESNQSKEKNKIFNNSSDSSNFENGSSEDEVQSDNEEIVLGSSNIKNAEIEYFEDRFDNYFSFEDFSLENERDLKYFDSILDKSVNFFEKIVLEKKEVFLELKNFFSKKNNLQYENDLIDYRFYDVVVINDLFSKVCPIFVK